jgi:hypothetical protein
MTERCMNCWRVNQIIRSLMFLALCKSGPLLACLALADMTETATAQSSKDALPEIRQLLKIQEDLVEANLGKYYVVTGDELVWTSKRKGCTAGVLYFLDEPLGGSKRLDGSISTAYAGDAFQIDFGVIDPRQSIVPQPICLRRDNNGSCLEDGMEVEVRSQGYPDERFIQAAPIWRTPEGKHFMPSGKDILEDMKNNNGFTEIGGVAPLLLMASNHSPEMKFRFRKDQLSLVTNLLGEIVSKCQLDIPE